MSFPPSEAWSPPFFPLYIKPHYVISAHSPPWHKTCEFHAHNLRDSSCTHKSRLTLSPRLLNRGKRICFSVKLSFSSFFPSYNINSVKSEVKADENRTQKKCNCCNFRCVATWSAVWLWSSVWQVWLHGRRPQVNIRHSVLRHVVEMRA